MLFALCRGVRDYFDIVLYDTVEARGAVFELKQSLVLKFRISRRLWDFSHFSSKILLINGTKRESIVLDYGLLRSVHGVILLGPFNSALTHSRSYT